MERNFFRDLKHTLKPCDSVKKQSALIDLHLQGIGEEKSSKRIRLKKLKFRSPNGTKGSRSEAEDAGVKLRVDRARRKTVGPLLKPAPSAGVTNKQTKQSSPPSSRPTTTVAEPIVETARAASVPDLPEGRTLLEVFLQLFFR